MEFMHFSPSAWYVEINARPEYLSGLNIADLHFRERTDRSLVNSRNEAVALGLPPSNPFRTLLESTLSFRVNFRVAAKIEARPHDT